MRSTVTHADDELLPQPPGTPSIVLLVRTHLAQVLPRDAHWLGGMVLAQERLSAAEREKGGEVEGAQRERTAGIISMTAAARESGSWAELAQTQPQPARGGCQQHVWS